MVATIEITREMTWTEMLEALDYNDRAMIANDAAEQTCSISGQWHDLDELAEHTLSHLLEQNGGN